MAEQKTMEMGIDQSAYTCSVRKLPRYQWTLAIISDDRCERPCRDMAARGEAARCDMTGPALGLTATRMTSSGQSDNEAISNSIVMKGSIGRVKHLGIPRQLETISSQQ